MSTEEGSNTRFKLGLSAGVLTLLGLLTLGSLLLCAAIAGGIIAMILAMMPGEPVASVALDPWDGSRLAWTEGAHAQEIWMEVDLSHQPSDSSYPWIEGDLVLDGERLVAFYRGEAVLAGDRGKMTANWRQDGSHVQGWVRVMKLEQAGAGTEHTLKASLGPGGQTELRILRLHVVDCDNWSCDPDRLF